MTYNEADKKRKEMALKLQNGIKPTNPPHDLLALIIAPEGSSPNTQQYIFEQCSKDWGTEERVLLELNAFSSDLNLFVVFKMKGKLITMTLEGYLSSNFGDGNAS